MLGLGTHHRSVRKRIYKNLEQFPSPRMYMRALDVLVYIAGFLGPAFTIPQIYQIYVYQDATGVSALSWGIFAALDTVWIVYGLVHKERIITFTYTLWCIANAIVCVGALMYGAHI